MATLTISVGAEDAARLQMLARLWKCSESEVVSRLLLREQPEVEPATGEGNLVASSPDTPVKPILEEILELMKEVPEAEFRRLPPDGLENLDHYLYGAPKKQR
jgi:hypothetical protein